MIATKEFDPQTVKRAYNRRGWIYSKTVAHIEWEYQLEALEKANIQPSEKVLEVAVGPGLAIVELAGRVGKGTTVYGIDMSTGMVGLAEQNLKMHGYSNYDLKEADSRQLPFDDNSFDVLYNAYMLDLIPIPEMPKILAEFRRVLRPGGRLVLLNMSKPDETVTTTREKLYKFLPAKLVPYLMGGCRPVLMEFPVKMAGFQDVTRRFLGGKAPSEIVLAKKPSS
jgi:demethylmenaquinone methyltransferase/2-methoxy-6-polyprenyl-1,4-benzoquinol methylase